MTPIEASKFLYERKLVSGTDGNLSQRIGDTFLVSKKNQCKGINPEFVSFKIGEPVPKEASSEFKTHLALYESLPDIKFVVHAHPVNVNVLSFCQKSHLLLNELNFCPENVIKLGRVIRIPYKTPSSDELHCYLKSFASKNCSVYILERHGVIVSGSDLLSCVTKIEKLEYAAEIIVKSLSIGFTPTRLSDEEMKDLSVHYSDEVSEPIKI